MGEPALKICLFGTFQILVDDKEIPLSAWKSKKALLLCKLLVCNRGKKVQRSVLANSLWPNADCTDVEHNLHTVVYMLRRTLEPSLKRFQSSCFVSQCDGLYWFEAEAPCLVDTEEFDRLIQQGNALQSVNPPQALKCFQKALELYKDDFLVDELYSDWTVEYREHYRESFLEATLKASRLLASLKNDYSNAVKLCRKALAKDPCREDLHEAIISYWIAAKRFDKAVAQYKQCEELLQEEYGLEPSKEVQSLIAGITTGNDVASARDELTAQERGAFICDKTLFSLLHQLERRRQTRSGAPLIVLTVAFESNPDSRSTVLTAIAETLRQGDVAADTGECEFQVLLVGVEPVAVPIIKRRLTRALKSACNLPFTFDYIVENNLA